MISGYLITALLLREYKTFGSISLWNFYIRRIFRILPACYVYVCVVAMLGAFIGALHVTSWDLFSSLSFTWNYSQHASSWALEHLWSLSVEEQFYLLWPSALAIFLQNAGQSKVAKLIWILILGAPLSRVLTHYLGSSFYAGHIPYLLHTRMDSLMFGCFCAFFQRTDKFEQVYRMLARFIWLFPIYAFLISPLLRFRFEDRYLFTVGYTLEGFCIALTMLWLVRNKTSIFGRILNAPIVVWIGVLSYSLYIWQQLFLNANNHWVAGHLRWGLFGVFVSAIFSYKIVEQPFLRWRLRFERPRRPSELQEKPGLESFAPESVV